MVKDYKVAYPSGAKLNSQMFSCSVNADKFASKKPFSMIMKLEDMNSSGGYSWSIISVGLGWVFLFAIILYLLFR